MSNAKPDNHANLTQRLNAGDHHDRELMTYVYHEMERLARRALRQGARGPTLSTGSVVNEAYVRIFAADQSHRFNDRGHFLATAATAMRHILVDYARSRMAQKRGSGNVISFDSMASVDLAIEDDSGQIVAINDAIEALDQLDPRARRVFEMRFIAGIEVVDVAAALGISEPTVKRDARFARAFIGEKLNWTTP